MTFIDEKIKKSCETLKNYILSDFRDIEDVDIIPCGYKESNTPPSDSEAWQRYKGEEICAPIDSHFWFRFTVDVPKSGKNFENRLIVKTGREKQWDATNPQFTVFVDSETAWQTLDTNHPSTPIPSGKHSIYLYFYNGMIPSSVKLSFALAKADNEIEGLYYDLFVPYNAMMCLPKNSTDYAKLQNILNRATMLLDFRHGRTKEFFEGVTSARDFMKKELFENKKLCGKAEHEISLIGHTHIDVAWKWTLAQSREKAQRSFATAVKLMEKYPDYIFMSSQPQLFVYVKENDSVLYEKIKKRVAEGRFEVEGSMWLESDTNLVSGESLIRQILLGKRFMREEFGVENKSLWLPDVFGYSAALPQILKKSGVPQFFTTKISWCETDKFPHDDFIWQGIDGSEVFAVLSESYVRNLDPKLIYTAWNEQHINKNYTDTHVSTFGYGDGGGGPTAEMMENYERLKYGLPGFPNAKIRKSAETLDIEEAQFRKNAKELRFAPKWSGELYLELHRGTYTSIAKNKKNNRKSEFLYQDAEALSVTAELFDKNNGYPFEILDANWHEILKNQFHDVLPGSSIKEVYDDSDRDYAKIIGDGEKIVGEKLAYLAKNVKSEGGLLVYNSTPYTVSDVIDTPNGKFTVCGIPSHGYATVQPKKPAKASVKASKNTLENDILRVKFDRKYHIISIIDKRCGREVIPSGEVANVLEVYEDYPRNYDAWEITEYYKQKKWIADDVESVETVNEGIYAGIKVTRKYCDSLITQTISLRDGSARLDFKTEVDWHEDHVLLKAAFPLDIHTQTATYEIQFGHIERPTHRNTSWDEAKFEVCGHKWADMSENGYGVSLLNDCKYGHSAEENVLRLSLLKTASNPNPYADREHHSFTYSLYPHMGTLAEGGTIKEAYLLNKPLVCVASAHSKKASLPESYSLVTSSNEAFAVETVKKGEDGSSIIIRGYESFGGKAKTHLTFGFEAEKAYLCDLMENNISELTVADGGVDISAGNFEIVTVKVIAK